MGYYAQHVMDGLGGDRTVLEELQEHAPLANQGTLRNLAGAFGFQDDDVFKPICVLSGGETRARRAREAALRRAEPARARRADEPPRHRDQARARQARSRDYEGTLIFVSHDRQFLSRARDARARARRSPGHRAIYGGSYDEYVASTGREAPGMRTE